MKIRHGKFSDCRSLGASIEVVIRSGSVGQEMFNEAYSWGFVEHALEDVRDGLLILR